MPVFISREGQLRTLSTLPCRYEKDLQKLIEENLMTVLEMHYLDSQYPTSNRGKIDTLAVDVNGAPVIIEYKRDRNNNVINQALSYLKWLKAQKPEFFRMLMLTKLDPEVFDRIRLDWNNPRIVCIAESFSRFDMDTAEVVPLRIELYRYCQYEESIFKFEPVMMGERGEETIPVRGDKSVFDVMKMQSHANALVQNLFDKLRERILSLDEHIIEKTGKKGVAYAISKHFCEIQIKTDMLVIDLRPVDYFDPREMVERIGVGYTITMNRRIRLKKQKDMDYVFSLIEQSYQNIL